MAARKAEVRRKTNETDVTLSLALDGSGGGAISTGVGFLDHMLDLLARHGLLDLKVQAKGDTHVDAHHTVEELRHLLRPGAEGGARRPQGHPPVGDCAVPMEDALAQVALDLGGRGALVFNVAFPTAKTGDFDVVLVEEFFRACHDQLRHEPARQRPVRQEQPPRRRGGLQVVRPRAGSGHAD